MAAITTAAIGAGTAIYSAKKASSNAKQANKIAQQGIEAADPYAKYRPEAAKQLSDLMANPSSIMDTPEYKARQQAVARQLASQGYTGSGNALIEAADAAGQSYQQAFNNLSTLSGAGQAPGGGYGTAAQTSISGGEQELSGIAGIANNLTNLGATIGGKFNQAASPQIGPVTKQPISIPQSKIDIGP